MRFRSSNGRVLAEDVQLRQVNRGEDEYPALLEHLPDPPVTLWVAGRSLAELNPAVAVVGTRTPTGYGREIAHALGEELGRAGVCVVSGMARGIDSFAHEGALERGTTIAVLAGGADVCYPSSNRTLYERIVASGAIVSEHPLGEPTYKGRFTHRNRIIAALALATVVVQAGERSGALATARHAATIGRDVFAIPGDIRVEVSAGCHELLKDGAFLCTSAGDVLEQVLDELHRSAVAPRLGPLPQDLPAEHLAILRQLGAEPVSADSVGAMAGLSGTRLAIALSVLELDGWIASGPGGTVRRRR